MEALAGFFREYAPMLRQGLGETCLMTFGALFCSYALGLPLGVLLTLTAYSAMAGAVGAGGLGDIAIRYGYHRYEYGVMMATLVLLILFVQLLQGVCALVARRMEERVR